MGGGLLTPMLRVFTKKLKSLIKAPHNSQRFMAEILAATPLLVATICMKDLLMRQPITFGISFSSKICPNEKTTRRWFSCFLVAQGEIEPTTQGFSIIRLSQLSLLISRAWATSLDLSKNCASLCWSILSMKSKSYDEQFLSAHRLCIHLYRNHMPLNFLTCSIFFRKNNCPNNGK